MCCGMRISLKFCYNCHCTSQCFYVLRLLEILVARVMELDLKFTITYCCTAGQEAFANAPHALLFLYLPHPATAHTINTQDTDKSCLGAERFTRRTCSCVNYTVQEKGGQGPRGYSWRLARYTGHTRHHGSLDTRLVRPPSTSLHRRDRFLRFPYRRVRIHRLASSHPPPLLGRCQKASIDRTASWGIRLRQRRNQSEGAAVGKNISPRSGAGDVAPYSCFDGTLIDKCGCRARARTALPHLVRDDDKLSQFHGVC